MNKDVEREIREIVTAHSEVRLKRLLNLVEEYGERRWQDGYQAGNEAGYVEHMQEHR